MRFLPWEYAVRNLGRSTLRLALGIAGSALVVLLVLAAASFVRGMGESLRGSGNPDNAILLGAGSEESIERSEIPWRSAGIAAASIPGIRSRLGVAYVSPEIHAALQVEPPGGGTAFANVRGVTPAAFLVHPAARLAEGRLPGPGEVLAGGLAEERMGLPPGALDPGAAIRVDGHEWKVSGRLAAPGSVIDAEIWMPLQDLRVATRRETLSCVVLALEGPERFADADLFAKQRLDLELVALREDAYYRSLQAFYRPVRMMVWATALLVAAGAFLGGLNTMYAAFASRVRELGALQVLGFSRGAILASLVQESLLVAAAGALAGSAAALAFLDGRAVRISMGAFGLVVDAPVAALGLGTGLALGVLGTLPPAWRCLRLPVGEALKAV